MEVKKKEMKVNQKIGFTSIKKDKYAIWNRIGHFLFEMNMTNKKKK